MKVVVLQIPQHEDEEVMVEIDSDMEEYWNSVIGNY